MAKSATTLTTFRDQAGRPHKVVLMADRLLIDIVGTEPPRVLALLRDDEGIDQARAIVFGTETEPGYAERAKREGGPLCRPLERADLAAPEPDPPKRRGDEDWPVAA